MIPPIDPWVWVLMALILQPLIALIWLYLTVRAVVAYTTGAVGDMIDQRIDNVLERVDQ